MTVNQHYEAGTEEADRKDAEIARLRAEVASYHDAYEMEKTGRAAEAAAKDKLIAELVEALREISAMNGGTATNRALAMKMIASEALSRAKEQQT